MCVNCGLPCLGSSCSMREFKEMPTCDNCGGSGNVFENGFCADCYLATLPPVACHDCGSYDENLYNVDGVILCENCTLKNVKQKPLGINQEAAKCK